MMIKKISFIFVFFSLFFSSLGQTSSHVLENILEKHSNYTQEFYSQKIFVHTDKDRYIVGETIWFTAYLIDGTTHRPDTFSTNVYVELINPNQEIQQFRLLKNEDGVTAGYFPLPDSLLSGKYQIRSFTNLMKNFPQEYIFTKEIEILNPKNEEITRNQHWNYRRARRHKNFFKAEFFPKPGNWILNIDNEIGVKFTDYVGKGLKTSGYIVDDKKNKVANFVSDSEGNAFFNFKPEKDKKYKFVAISVKDKKLKIKLKDFSTYGYSLNLKNREAEIEAKVNLNLLNFNETKNNTFYLIAESRGRIVFMDTKICEENGEYMVKIPKSKLPEGILKVSIFSGNGKLQAEKLCFVEQKNKAKIEVNQSKKKNKVFVEIKNNNLDSNSILSISILNKKEPQNSDNIVKSILINSALKNKIKTSDFDSLAYAIKANISEKYSWANILKEKQDTPTFKKEKGIKISGKVTQIYMNVPIKDASITLSILSEFNDIFQTSTNKEGEFVFKNLVYNDTIDFLLEGTNMRGKDNLLIYRDYHDTIPIDFMPMRTEKSKKYRRKNLPEKKNSSKHSSNSLHGAPDQVIYFKDINTAGYSNIFEILNGRVPGLEATGGMVKIRGYSSINQSSTPLFLINNIPTSMDAVWSLSPQDVERVEIVKSSAKNAIYGSRGGNGVIAVYTKQGHHIHKGKLQSWQTGYHVTKNFEISKINYPINYYQTIYWQPKLKVAPNKTRTINFELPKNTNEYKIIIQGVSEKGDLIYFEKVFTDGR